MPWSSYSRNDRRYPYFTSNLCNRDVDSFNPKSTGLLSPGAALGGGGGAGCFPSIRSRHPRELKLTGLIAYIMLCKITNLEAQQ